MPRDRTTWRLIGSLAAAFTLLTALVIKGGAVVEIDWRVHLWADARPQSWVSGAAYAVALVGGRWILLWPLGAAALWLSWRERHWWPLGYTVTGVLGMVGGVGVAKLGIGRTAPAEGMGEVFAGGLSYPSGHTVNVIVLGWLLVRLFAWLFPLRERRVRHTGAWLVGAGAVLMSACMVYLDYHWVSDMVASFFLGPLILVTLDRVLLRLIRGPRERAREPEVART